MDLLLLNASNLPWRPIYPYAFVQVSEVARRHGLKVKRLDLLEVRRELWKPLLQRLVREHAPRMVGLHLRQGDSVFLDDYHTPPSRPPTGRRYFPVEDSRELVRTVRDVCRVPVVAGGFGFTTHARPLFQHLELDYGVQGCPDDFFRRFEDVAAGRDLGSVQGLMWREGTQAHVNARGYFSPATGREYTDEIVDELVGFYGHASLYGPNPTTVAVEVMRGCPFRCYFCTEPHVKGQRMAYRDLDVVEDELRFLLSRQLSRFWFICSELNIQGMDFALRLAERMVRLREETGVPVEWSGYSLPRMKEPELRLLQRAGYVGALNDVLSLDDDNLRRARVPYRSGQAVAFLKAMAKLAREDEEAKQRAKPDSPGDIVRGGLTHRTPKELASLLSLFLGNAHTTPETIPRTLRRIEEEGLRDNYRAGYAIPATRVFAPGDTPICDTREIGLRTYDAKGERPVNLLWPTFYFPAFLVERLGSPDAVLEFFTFVADTFMSTGHRMKRDWAAFLSHATSVECFHRWLAEGSRTPPAPGPDARAGALVERLVRTPDVAGVRSLFSPPALEKAAWSAVAEVLVAHVLDGHRPQVEAVLALLGLPQEEGRVPLSEYRLLERLSRRFTSHEDLEREVRDGLGVDDASVELFFLRWLLFTNNVVLRPGYRELLFDAEVSPAVTRAAG